MASGGVLAEFVVAGRPVSLQARRRERVREWRDTVRGASVRGVTGSAPPATEPVAVEITCYLDEVDIDVDNIAKPVLDALKGGLLADDKQVWELVVRKRETASASRSELPLAVARALVFSRELVHVVVRTLPSGDGPG